MDLNGVNVMVITFLENKKLSHFIDFGINLPPLSTNIHLYDKKAEVDSPMKK